MILYNARLYISLKETLRKRIHIGIVQTDFGYFTLYIGENIGYFTPYTGKIIRYDLDC